MSRANRKRLCCAVAIAAGLGMELPIALGEAAKGWGGVVQAPDGGVMRGRNWALLIAIDRYEDWRSLQYPVSDLQAFKKIILERYAFQPEHVVELYDQQATKRGIIRALETMPAKLDASDSLLIYYSGHGYKNPRTGVGYWIPHDAGRDHWARTNWINNADVRGVIASLKCRHVLLISDSCFAGDILDTSKGRGEDHTPRYYVNAWKLESRQALTAGASEEVPDKSWFAYHLRRFLETNTQPYVDPEDIHVYVKRGVAELPLFGSLKDAGHVHGGSHLFMLGRGAGGSRGDEWDKLQKELERKAAEHRAQAQKRFALAEQADKATYIDRGQKIKLWQAYLRDFRDTGHQVEHAQTRLAHWKAWREPEPGAGRPGDVATNPKDGAEMVWIPAGEFLMGADRTENERIYDKFGWDKDWIEKYAKDEAPKHRVQLDGFWIYKYEVTVGQFQKFVNATGYKTEAEKEGWSYWFNTDKSTWEKGEGISWRCPFGKGQPAERGHPVVCVSWNDAHAYCRWAGVRLPTEAEWEYAARGGDTGLAGKPHHAFVWGSDAPNKPVANMWDESAARKWPKANYLRFANYDDGHAYTAPVGTYPANGFGLFDMAGNAWEWCSDWYGEKYYAESPAKNPTGPREGKYRVARGAAWYDNPDYLRVSNRGWIAPEFRYTINGFRSARTPH